MGWVMGFSQKSMLVPVLCKRNQSSGDRAILWVVIQKSKLETMANLQKLFIFSALVVMSKQEPFIFEEKVDTCSYSVGKKNKKIEMTSNLRIAKFEHGELYYKFCGKFTTKDSCPAGTAACLRHLGKIITFGSEFHLDQNENFLSSGGEVCSKHRNYSMVVSLHCDQPVEATLDRISEDRCTYYVNMQDPKCLPACTIIIDGKFIDLRDLERSFFVNAPAKNYSVSLCGSNPICDNVKEEDLVNACEIIGNEQIAISLASSMSASYIGEKNQLLFHGVTYKGTNKKIDKRLEVILKCDWDKTTIDNEDLKYIKPQTQGKKYKFELETSFGCIKRPIPCVVHDQFVVYNLSGLYSESQGMRFTHGKNSATTYFLEVCGPVKLEGRNTSCKSTYAQVCENTNGKDINRGSVLNKLEVIDNVVKVRIDSGTQCQENKNLQYDTIIDFHCTKDDTGPTFFQQKNCTTFFTWSTPQACPEYNVSSCSHIHEERHNCSFKTGNNYYDLRNLSKSVKSINESNRVFMFRICEPVRDPDAPCMKDVSVILKNLEEFNVKRKVISLGKFAGSSLVDGSLVLDYFTGSYCDGSDYSSKIIFKCDILQEEPKLIREEKCFFEFLWKTKYACPIKSTQEHKIKDLENCTYIDINTNTSVDFSRIDPTSVHLVDALKFQYSFDLCQNNYTNCTYDNVKCQYASFNNTRLMTSHNSTVLEFTLPNGCYTQEEFNKVKFYFFCDEIKNNDHVGSVEIVNCTLVIHYFTNLVCSLKEHYIPRKNIPEKNNPVFPSIANLTSIKLVEEDIECFSKSPFTNEELDIKKLELKNLLLKHNCPKIVFNNTHRYVKLLYASTELCRQTKNVSYEVYLKCTKDILPSKMDECLEHYNFENLEYCKFFESPGQHLLSAGLTIGIIGGSLALLLVLSMGIYLAIKKKLCRGNQSHYNGLLTVYQKDTEL